jgi:hypothetical protein
MPGEIWGRGPELAHASRALGTLSTDAVALVLFGDEGIGKTTVWEHVLSQAEDRG